MALDDKTRFKMEADRHRDEVNEKRRQCDTLEQVSKWCLTCLNVYLKR